MMNSLKTYMSKAEYDRFVKLIEYVLIIFLNLGNQPHDKVESEFRNIC